MFAVVEHEEHVLVLERMSERARCTFAHLSSQSDGGGYRRHDVLWVPDISELEPPGSVPR